LNGLLGLIRLKEPGPASLALGFELTTLGLNLNSQNNLYKTFGSPWSNEPAKGEHDYQIPACFSAEPPLAQQVSFLTFWLLLAPQFLTLQYFCPFLGSHYILSLTVSSLIPEVTIFLSLTMQPLHFQRFHPLTLFYIFYRY
jgi:hypothetical protein